MARAAKPASLPVYPQIPVEFRPAWFDGAPEIKKQIKIKSGSLRIVVTVGCYNLQNCVDAATAVFQELPC